MGFASGRMVALEGHQPVARQGTKGRVRFGESADIDQAITRIIEAKVFDDSVPFVAVGHLWGGVFANDADPVCVVHINPGVVLFGETRKFWQRRIGTRHGVDPINGDDFALIVGILGQLLL